MPAVVLMMAGFGAYGKIPSQGDFLRLNAPAAFVAPWDRWLQAAMLHSRAVLGDGWDTCYLSAPIWRFTLSRGLAGTSAILGVLMPSVDRVGRFFPLTLMTPVAGDAVSQHHSGQTTFAALEDIALATLDGTDTRDDLIRALSRVPSPPVPAAIVPPVIGQPSLWSALLQDETLAFRCDGLPPLHNSQRLFDAACTQDTATTPNPDRPEATA